jgi:pyruvate formate lyase activating enzyme
MKECYLYQKIEDKKVQCQTCNHRCTIIPGKRGICGVRENKVGKLYLLVYGKVIAAHIDPIEKKPLYHFMPGTSTYSIATVGCNFRCLWCQNADISQASKVTGYNLPIDEIPHQEVAPQEIVEEAMKNNCPSISYTYTEPTIFLELALDTMKLAHKKGLKNIWVSNGYMTSQALKLILPYLDAINIDLKSFKEATYQKFCGAKLKPVLKNIIKIKKAHLRQGYGGQAGVHIELTTLVIPDVNDSKQELRRIAEFIAKKVGKDTPWHLSRFFPAFKMTQTQITPTKTLKLAEKIGKDAGLKYVYLGNI